MALIVIGSILALVAGTVGGVAAGVSASHRSSDATSLLPMPADFPNGKGALLPGLTPDDMKKAMETWKCTDKDNWSIVIPNMHYYACTPSTGAYTYLSFTYIPERGVETVSVDCDTPVDKPEFCVPLLKSVVRFAFKGAPQFKTAAEEWVVAHIKQSAMTSLGPVDIKADLKSQTFSFSPNG